MLEKMNVGVRIREARVKKGYTQQLLAEKAGIGQVYLGEIERGTKTPSLKTFLLLVEALEVSADYVLRDALSSGGSYIFDELTEKLRNLTPKQRKGAADILDAYLKNL